MARGAGVEGGVDRQGSEKTCAWGWRSGARGRHQRLPPHRLDGAARSCSVEKEGYKAVNLEEGLHDSECGEGHLARLPLSLEVRPSGILSDSIVKAEADDSV